MLIMTSKLPFETQEEMANKIAQFFISTETQTHVINKLTKLKQENQLLEDFWSEFVTQKELSSYNEIALVELFKKGIYPVLAQKLVKISQSRNSDSLDDQYEKMLSFKRLRREVIKEFREKKNLEGSRDVMTWQNV